MSFPNAYEMVYWGDELRETIGLSATALGAYTLIRIAYWDKMQRNIPFDNDDRELQRITRLMGANFTRVKKELSSFFMFINGLIINQIWEDKFIGACQKYERRKAAAILSQQKRGNVNLPSPGHNNSQRPNDSKNVINQELNSSNAEAMPQQLESESDSYIKNIAKEEYNTKRQNKSEILDKALKAYNTIAVQHGGVICKVLNPIKQAKLFKRIEDAKGIDMFETILSEAVRDSQFLQGKSPPTEKHPKPFRISIDFICQEDSFNKILNGNYNDQPQTFNCSELRPTNKNYSGNEPASAIKGIVNYLARKEAGIRSW